MGFSSLHSFSFSFSFFLNFLKNLLDMMPCRSFVEKKRGICVSDRLWNYHPMFNVIVLCSHSGVLNYILKVQQPFSHHSIYGVIINDLNVQNGTWKQSPFTRLLALSPGLRLKTGLLVWNLFDTCHRPWVPSRTCNPENCWLNYIILCDKRNTTAFLRYSVTVGLHYFSFINTHLLAMNVWTDKLHFNR